MEFSPEWRDFIIKELNYHGIHIDCITNKDQLELILQRIWKEFSEITTKSGADLSVISVAIENHKGELEIAGATFDKPGDVYRRMFRDAGFTEEQIDKYLAENKDRLGL